MDNQVTDVRQAAKEYQENGLSILPLATGKKYPATPEGYIRQAPDPFDVHVALRHLRERIEAGELWLYALN